MTTANWCSVLIWTIAWGVTGASLYISGVFNSPQTGPLWVALAGGAISWSIAGVSTFSTKSGGSTKHWKIAILVIWALAYLASVTLGGLILNSSALSDTIMGLLIACIGWSAGAALGAFMSIRLAGDGSMLRRSNIVAGIWTLGFFTGGFISLVVAFLAAELAKIYIGFLIGVPAALILGFGFGCALGGFVASAIAITLTRAWK